MENKMLLYSYVMSNPDESLVLADCLTSLATFSDRIYLVDGGLGGGTLNHFPRTKEPLHYWLGASDECDTVIHFNNRWIGKWNGVPVFLYEHEFKDPASQRNYIIDIINREVDRPDWIVTLDSDEVFSLEAENGIRKLLSEMSSDTVGVYQKWLNLVQDESHCVGGHHSDWLAHPRIHRPDALSWSGTWHEHAIVDRSKLYRWDTRIIHKRALYRKLLLVQRGHPTIRERSKIAPEKGPFWDDAVMEFIPFGATWRPLTWPDDEISIPFESDALEYWTDKGENVHG